MSNQTSRSLRERHLCTGDTQGTNRHARGTSKGQCGKTAGNCGKMRTSIPPPASIGLVPMPHPPAEKEWTPSEPAGVPSCLPAHGQRDEHPQTKPQSAPKGHILYLKPQASRETTQLPPNGRVTKPVSTAGQPPFGRKGGPVLSGGSSEWEDTISPPPWLGTFPYDTSERQSARPPLPYPPPPREYWGGGSGT